ncbi:MAG: nitrogenase component 1 [Syntrophaceticus schinkii]|jgi:nitrogenase molybdenum-cofactor synthesis protein NifE|nr:nitrogenase component 1 [Syntrophaceticus schinkii]
MALVLDSAPTPSDYFGVLWALAGIKNALVLEHGATGTNFYNTVSFGVMNKQTPKGITFSTGLDEDDVVMGREEKIIEAARELDRLYRPEVISLVATAVTSVIGLDMDGIIEELQPQVNAKLLAFSGGGFRGDYTRGIKEVFCVLADNIAAQSTMRDSRAVNIIGPTIDSFNIPSDCAELVRLLSLLNIKVNTVFTNNTSVSQIKKLPSATLNIVTRDIALEAAEILKKRFGTPYLYGLPFGIKGTVTWLEEVAERLSLNVPHKLIAGELKRYGYTLAELASRWQLHSHLRVAVSCPYDYALGLTRLIREEWELEVAMVSLPTAPERNKAEKLFTALGVSRVLIAPEVEELKTALTEIEPHILFGNSYDFHLAPEVPIQIHAAIPAYDYINLFDGTPFVGFRGSLCLTQTLLNSLSCHREVLYL